MVVGTRAVNAVELGKLGLGESTAIKFYDTDRRRGVDNHDWNHIRRCISFNICIGHFLFKLLLTLNHSTFYSLPPFTLALNV